MASWKPNSHAVLNKLLKCQRIIGYTFRDISLLQESLSTGTNKRLATAGDTYVQVALVDRWFAISTTTSSDFDVIRKETVSNHNLAKVGFHRGLDACALPVALRKSQERAMADTVEALLGAVYRDALFDDGERKAEAANWAAFEGVIARLGLNHHLIASASDLRWSLNPMKTTRTLMRQFFSGGHHLALAKLIVETSSKLSSVKLDDPPRPPPVRSPRRLLKRTKPKVGDNARKVLSVKRRIPEDVPSDDSMEGDKASTEEQTKTTSNHSQPEQEASESEAVTTRRELEAERAESQRRAVEKARVAKKARRDRRRARKLAASNQLPTESHEV